MAATGRGGFPFRSGWLGRGGGKGANPRKIVKVAVTAADRAIWQDWAFNAASGNLTLTFTQLLDEGNTLYAPAVGLNLLPNLFSDGDTLYTPAIGLNLLPNLFSDGDTLYAPAVSAGGGVSATQPLQKPTAVLRIAVSRNVRDIYLNRRFKVEARYPGGRTILKAKVATRGRAFAAALRAAAPQTSATAAGGSGSYTSNPQGASGSIWQRNPEQAIVNEP